MTARAAWRGGQGARVLALRRKVNGPVHPETGRAAANLGFLLDKCGPEKNAKGAKTIAAWQEAVRINPENANEQYYLARLLVFNNRLEEAVITLRAAADLYPTGERGHDMRERLAKALTDLGRKDEAAKLRAEIEAAKK